MDGVALGVDFEEHTGEEHASVEVAIQGSQVVGIGIADLDTAKHVVPALASLLAESVEVGVAQFLEVLQGLVCRDKR